MLRIASVGRILILCAFCVMIVACTEQGSIKSPASEKQPVDEVSEKIVVEEGEGDELLSINDGKSVLNVSFDSNTRILHYRCGDYHLEFGYNYVREYTSSDELIFWLENTENFPQRTEVYVYNGRMVKIDVMDMEPSAKNIQDFLGFYESDPYINTLEASRGGEQLFELLEKAGPQLLQIWQERDPEGYLLSVNEDRDMLGRPVWGDYTCGGAFLCVSSKCWFGGLANPVCLVCTAAVSACIVMDMFGLW